MKTIKNMISFVLAIIWLTSAMLLDCDSIIPLITFWLSFLLWVPFYWRKRRVKRKYYY